MNQEALVIVRGDDRALRTFCSGMLMAGLATHAEFCSAWSMFVRGDEVESTAEGRVVMLRVPAAHVASCLEQLRAEIDDVSAVAIPVLASI